MKTYCCYGASVEVGCDADCPTKAVAPADPIVGHKTFRDGDSFRHEPLRQSEASAILAAAEAAEAKRAAESVICLDFVVAALRERLGVKA